MATDPTTLPTIADIQQSKKDMEDITEFNASESNTFIDNYSRTRKTLTGIENEADNLISEKTTEFDQVIDQYKESRGFNTKGTFADGFTYELPNDVGLDSDGNPWVLIDTSSLPVIVSAGTTPTSPTYTQVTFNQASQVSTKTNDTVQSFVDSFALKIFQSPTEGGLTEIQTRTVNANEVYEVRKTSDDSLATIYSDAASPTEILQNGIDNKSGSDGVVEFYIADGSYYVEVDSVKSNFQVDVLRQDLAATDSTVLVGGVEARNLYYYRQSPDPLATAVGSRGFSLLIGEDAIQHEDVVGAGCVLIGGSTDQKNRLIGYGWLRGIVGGYDNEITGDTNNVGGLACFIVGSHHSEIQGNTTHGFISGGSYNRILSGDYSNILGGTANEIRAVRADDVTPVSCHTSTICGGSNNIITNANSFIGGGRNNSCDGVYSFVGSGRGLNAAGEFCVVSGGAENQTLRGPSGTGQQNTISGGRDNLIDSATGSPQQSTIGGGNTNKIYGTQSTISGGWTNSIGSISQNTGVAVICGGRGGVVLADMAVVSGGRDNTINAGGTYGSITGGRLNQVTAFYARAGGHQSVGRHAGGDSWADGAFSVAGDAQCSKVMRRVQTTSATLASMTTVGLPDNSTYMFEVSIVARRTDDINESAAYKLTGCIDRYIGEASTSLVGEVTKTVIAEDVPAWDVTVIGNPSSGGLTIQVTGEAAKTIRWVAKIDLVEVSG